MFSIKWAYCIFNFVEIVSNTHVTHVHYVNVYKIFPPPFGNTNKIVTRFINQKVINRKLEVAH